MNFDFRYKLYPSQVFLLCDDSGEIWFRTGDFWSPLQYHFRPLKGVICDFTVIFKCNNKQNYFLNILKCTSNILSMDPVIRFWQKETYATNTNFYLVPYDASFQINQEIIAIFRPFLLLWTLTILNFTKCKKYLNNWSSILVRSQSYCGLNRVCQF